MQIDSNAPTREYKFMGFTTAIPAPYVEGQTLDANTTKFINRQFASVIGNLVGQAIRREVDAQVKAGNADFKAENLTQDWVNAKLTEILTSYEPGVSNTRTGAATSHDPVQAIADSIAWEKIKERLKAKGHTINSVKADKRRELIAQYHEKFPNLLEEAKAIYAASTKGNDTAAEDEDFLDFSGIGEGEAEGNDSTPGTDSATDSTPADVARVEGSEPADNTAPVPPSEPSSTAETNGTDAADNGTSPSNPGTVGTTGEGTGQGTPATGGAFA